MEDARDAADAAIFGGRPRLLSKVRVQLERLHEKSCWPEEWLQAQPLALVGSLPANIRLGADNPSLDGDWGCRLSRTRRVRLAKMNCRLRLQRYTRDRWRQIAAQAPERFTASM